MKPNLNTMRTEIREYLESRGMTPFYGYERGGEPSPAVYWNVENHPDYREFLATAEAAGVRLVTFYAHEFTEDLIEDAVERLNEAALPREEQRMIDGRLREMGAYVGFTCQIELSFDLAPRVYIFDLRTEWFDEMNEMLDRIDDSYGGQVDDDEAPLGGYFSKN